MRHDPSDARRGATRTRCPAAMARQCASRRLCATPTAAASSSCPRRIPASDGYASAAATATIATTVDQLEERVTTVSPRPPP